MNRFIETTRFGKVEISTDHIIRFRDGMIGFHTLKDYVIVESSSLPILLWLQSVDAPEVAFPVMEPWFFKRDYATNTTEADKLSINLEASNKTKTFVVLTIPSEMMRMTVNLKAPIIVNLDKALATQVILQDKALVVRMPAFEDFNKAVSQVQSQFKVTDTVTDNWSPVTVRSREVSAGGVG